MKLTLGGSSAREWFSLFKRLEGDIPAAQGVTPLSRVKESLKSLDIKNCPNLIIDAHFASPIWMFRNLVTLNVGASCRNIKDDNRCIFKLNNDEVTKLAMALPQLQCLVLGDPCPANTCATTIACLLQISIHCIELQKLKVHFNTTNIVDDLKKISEDPKFQELLPLPRCALVRLDVWLTPLVLDKPGFEAAVSGMVGIFPSLERCEGYEQAWAELSRRLVEFHGA